MAKKEKKLTGESFTVRSYGTGWTVNGTRYYEGDEKNHNFEEVYADRMTLIKGLAEYLGLGVAREERPRFPGMLSIFEISGSDKEEVK